MCLVLQIVLILYLFAKSLNFSDTAECMVLVFINLLHNGQSAKEEDCKSMICI